MQIINDFIKYIQTLTLFLCTFKKLDPAPAQISKNNKFFTVC